MTTQPATAAPTAPATADAPAGAAVDPGDSDRPAGSEKEGADTADASKTWGLKYLPTLRDWKNPLTSSQVAMLERIVKEGLLWLFMVGVGLSCGYLVRAHLNSIPEVEKFLGRTGSGETRRLAAVLPIGVSLGCTTFLLWAAFARLPAGFRGGAGRRGLPAWIAAAACLFATVKPVWTAARDEAALTAARERADADDTRLAHVLLGGVDGLWRDATLAPSLIGEAPPRKLRLPPLREQLEGYEIRLAAWADAGAELADEMEARDWTEVEAVDDLVQSSAGDGTAKPIKRPDRYVLQVELDDYTKSGEARGTQEGKRGSVPTSGPRTVELWYPPDSDELAGPVQETLGDLAVRRSELMRVAARLRGAGAPNLGAIFEEAGRTADGWTFQRAEHELARLARLPKFVGELLPPRSEKVDSDKWSVLAKAIEEYNGDYDRDTVHRWERGMNNLCGPLEDGRVPLLVAPLVRARQAVYEEAANVREELADVHREGEKTLGRVVRRNLGNFIRDSPRLLVGESPASGSDILLADYAKDKYGIALDDGELRNLVVSVSFEAESQPVSDLFAFAYDIYGAETQDLDREHPLKDFELALEKLRASERSWLRRVDQLGQLAKAVETGSLIDGEEGAWTEIVGDAREKLSEYHVRLEEEALRTPSVADTVKFERGRDGPTDRLLADAKKKAWRALGFRREHPIWDSPAFWVNKYGGRYDGDDKLEGRREEEWDRLGQDAIKAADRDSIFAPNGVELLASRMRDAAIDIICKNLDDFAYLMSLEFSAAYRGKDSLGGVTDPPKTREAVLQQWEKSDAKTRVKPLQDLLAKSGADRSFGLPFSRNARLLEKKDAKPLKALVARTELTGTYAAQNSSDLSNLYASDYQRVSAAANDVRVLAPAKKGEGDGDATLTAENCYLHHMDWWRDDPEKGCIARLVAAIRKGGSAGEEDVQKALDACQAFWQLRYVGGGSGFNPFANLKSPEQGNVTDFDPEKSRGLQERPSVALLRDYMQRHDVDRFTAVERILAAGFGIDEMGLHPDEKADIQKWRARRDGVRTPQRRDGR